MYSVNYRVYIYNPICIVVPSNTAASGHDKPLNIACMLSECWLSICLMCACTPTRELWLSDGTCPTHCFHQSGSLVNTNLYLRHGNNLELQHTYNFDLYTIWPRFTSCRGDHLQCVLNHGRRQLWQVECFNMLSILSCWYFRLLNGSQLSSWAYLHELHCHSWQEYIRHVFFLLATHAHAVKHSQMTNSIYVRCWHTIIQFLLMFFLPFMRIINHVSAYFLIDPIQIFFCL